MDIEDYYFRTKNSKKRRFEGTSRRKGHTIRNTDGPRRRVKGKMELVGKTIRTTEKWDEKRINEYCENVLGDGGMTPHPMDCYSGGLSMKKQKRWTLSKQIRTAMNEEVENSEAPNVLLVERAIGPDYSALSSYHRGNVTRATYVSTKPATDISRMPKKSRNVGNRRIVDRTPNGNHKYSYEKDLTGRMTDRRNGRRREDGENETPEVEYEFCYACPPDRCSGDITSAKPSSYKYGTKNEGYFDQIQEYYYGRKHDIDWTSDGDGLHSLDGDTEIEDGKIERQNEIAIDSLIQNMKASSSLNKEKRKARRTKGSPRAAGDDGGNNKKNKVVRVAESENSLFVNQNTQVNTNLAPLLSLKLGKCAMEEFISEQQQGTVQKLVEFANLRPVAFVADISPWSSENTRNENFHLVFQTDFDPDVFEEECFTKEFEVCSVDIFMFCENDEFSKLVSKHLRESAKEMKSIEEASDLEVLILCAKQFAQQNWPIGNENRRNFVDSQCSERQKPRETKRVQIAIAVNGIGELVGLNPKYRSLEELESDRIFTESSEFGCEIVGYPLSGEKCHSCGILFKENSETGSAIAACRHWFCQKCLTTHLKKSNDFFVKCIEESCSATANSAARMILYMRSGISESHFHRGKYGKRILYKCPISTCNQITMIKDSVPKPSMLTCHCNVTWCADCGADSHWPASCKAVQLYTTENNLLKRKSLFESVKVCPNCGDAMGQKIRPRMRWMRWPYFFPPPYIRRSARKDFHCQKCGYRYNCWHCLGTHVQIDNYKRRNGEEMLVNLRNHVSGLSCGQTYHNHAEIPAQKIVFSDDLRFDMDTAEVNQKAIKKHVEALSDSEFSSQAKSRVLDYFEKKEDRDEMLSFVTELLLVKNQLHYVILYTDISLRYGSSIKTSRTVKSLEGILKKMEILIKRMEYLLLKRDYQSRDFVFPETCQSIATNGRGLIKELFRKIQKDE